MNHQAALYNIDIILILKQDLTVYTLFILRGGKNMRNYFP